MLSKLAEGRQKYGLIGYLRRQANQEFNRLFFHLNEAKLVQAFRSIGVQDGTTVCAHSALSRLGYIENGPGTVVDALLAAVGPRGCVMMPAFSMGGSMLSYVESGSVFDVRSTPSQVGAIPEVFRRRAGVIRSLHPTNSVTAFGQGARELVRGHDASRTPFGFGTPYGKLVDRDDTFVLMLDTHVQSLLHHVQERVSFPNLLLEREAEVQYVDHDGVAHTMSTKVMRPKLPYFVAVPGERGGEPDWVTLHDFSLMFPSRRRRDALAMGYRAATIKMLEDRRRWLVDKGVLRSRRLGRAEIGLVHVKSFVKAVQPLFEESIETYRAYYDVTALGEKNLRLL
jgi:aminoglycoside N3'-acetyltransferase